MKRNYFLEFIGFSHIANMGSKEIHDLEHFSKRCNIDKITNGRYIWSERRWIKKGFNGCRFCNKKEDKG